MRQNKFHRFFWLACFLFALAVTTSGQGVYEAWVARYNGPGDFVDRPSALAVDDSGYVYVTGTSSGITTTDDYVTIKYDLNGDTLWVRHYNGIAASHDFARPMAIDRDGNVYVTGRSQRQRNSCRCDSGG